MRSISPAVAAAIGLTLAPLGCGPSAPPATVQISAASGSIDADDPAPSKITFHPDKDFTFSPLGKAAVVKPLTADAVGGLVWPDGTTILATGVRAGAHLFSAAHPAGVALPAGPVWRRAVSPDGRRFLTIDEDFTLRLYDAPDGRITFMRSDVKAARFSGPDTLLVFDGCRLSKSSLKAPSFNQVSEDVCGRTVEATPDGSMWIVAEERPNTSPILINALTSIDGAGLRARPLRSVTREGPISSPTISPRGDRICYLRQPQSALDCLALPAGKEQEIAPEGVTGPLEFDGEGRRLAFGVKGPDGVAIKVASFNDGSIRQLLPRAERLPFWTFLSGAPRIVVHDIQGAVVYDLDQGWSLRVVGPHVETGGVDPFPGDPRRFLLGIERGSSRDLSRVDLPR